MPLTEYASDAPATKARNNIWSEKNCCTVVVVARKGLKTPNVNPAANIVSHGTTKVAASR
jgi:hypothetical protein